MTTQPSTIATTARTAPTHLRGARRILALAALGATVATGAIFGVSFAPHSATPAHTQIASGGSYQAGPGGSGGPGGW